MSAICQNGRLLWCSVIMVIICAIASAADAQISPALEKRGLPVEGVILTATLAKNAIAPGDPVILNLTMCNEGLQTPHFLVSNPLIDYSLMVQDDKGQLVPLKKKLPPMDIFAGLVAVLFPTEESSALYPVTQAYDLTTVGTYRITAMRDILTPDGKDAGDVVSNTVVLTVSNTLSKKFTLTASLRESVVAQGKPVNIQLTLRNTSTTAQTLTTADIWREVTLLVQDFKGDPLPITAVEAVAVAPAAERVLQPGETATWDLRLNERYDLGREGRYFITSMRQVPDGDGLPAQVFSNTLKLNVSNSAHASAALLKRSKLVAGVLLTAALADNAVAPGDPVDLHLTLRNYRPQTPQFVVSNPLADYVLVVQDEKGQLLVPKELPPSVSARSVAQLAPDQASSAIFPVMQVYDLTKIGTYRITAMRNILTPDGKDAGEVVSNTVVLTVSNTLSKKFTLTASMKEKDCTVAQGLPVNVQLTLKNISDTAQTVTTADIWREVTLLVQDIKGDPMRPKQGVTEAEATPAVERVLQPGEAMTWEMRVDERYNLSQRGRYFITAMRQVPNGDGPPEQVYSNTLLVIIARPPD